MRKKKTMLLLISLLAGSITLTACGSSSNEKESSLSEDEILSTADEVSDTDTYSDSTLTESTIPQDGPLYENNNMDIIEYEEGCDNLGGKVISMTDYDLLSSALLLTTDNKIYELSFDKSKYLFDVVTEAQELLDKTIECNILTLNKDGSYTLYNQLDSSQNSTFHADNLMCAYTDSGYFTYYTLEDSHLQVVSRYQDDEVPTTAPVHFDKAPLYTNDNDAEMLTHEPIKNALISTYCIDVS